MFNSNNTTEIDIKNDCIEILTDSINDRGKLLGDDQLKEPQRPKPYQQFDREHDNFLP